MTLKTIYIKKIGKDKDIAKNLKKEKLQNIMTLK